MGRGSSGIGGGSAAGGSGGGKDFPEAFAPGKDFQAVGGVDHDARTVSRTTQREWDQFSVPMSQGISATDETAIMREWTSIPNSEGAYVSGYVRTQNAFAINKALYDPNNAGKSDDQIFSRASDRKTVKALDKAINSNTTQADGAYTRYCSPSAVQATFGLSDSQMAMVQQAQSMSPAQLRQLNRALSGSQSHTRAYTSTSANRSLNAFSNPSAPQSRGFTFERRINVPKGTKAFAPRKNAQESEVIFGRGMTTRLTGISVSGSHIIMHESFVGYN